jgi:hypothetical protein
VRPRRRLSGLLPLLSWSDAHASWRVLAGPAPKLASTVFAPNGFRRYDVHDAAYAHGATFAGQLRASEALYAGVYSRYRRLDPAQERWFERTLARMDAWGEPPLVVLTPVQPAMRRALAPLGWAARRRQVLALLAGLHARYRFTFVDMTDLASFGGSPHEFYDGFHMTLPNVHRLLDTLVREDRRAL